jgi:hypothetical protein
MIKRNYAILIIFALYLGLPYYLLAQTKTDTATSITLQQCISYALHNQPQVKQATIDEEINERNIGIALADWLPQVNAAGMHSIISSSLQRICLILPIRVRRVALSHQVYPIRQPYHYRVRKLFITLPWLWLHVRQNLAGNIISRIHKARRSM